MTLKTIHFVDFDKGKEERVRPGEVQEVNSLFSPPIIFDMKRYMCEQNIDAETRGLRLFNQILPILSDFE
jgi:hypothetical protein